MEEVMNTLRDIALIVLPFIGVIALFYLLLLLRQLTITSKKVDYLVEDITYKSEMLNSTVETVVKVSNYVDAFEAVTKKNAKAAMRLAQRNKDLVFRFADKVRDYANNDK
jgi:hypothetical protein